VFDLPPHLQELPRRVAAQPLQLVLKIDALARGVLPVLLGSQAADAIVGAEVFYVPEARRLVLGGSLQGATTADLARAIASHALEAAINSGGDPWQAAGLACVCEQPSDHSRHGPTGIRSPTGINVALQTARQTQHWHLAVPVSIPQDGSTGGTLGNEEGLAGNFTADSASRAADAHDAQDDATPEHSRVCCAAVLQLLASLCDIALPPEGRTAVPLEKLTVTRSDAPPSWSRLLLGECPAVPARANEAAGTSPPAILPGAFNPLHEGHRQMARSAADLLGCRVEFELSIRNVDKPPLDFVAIERRLAHFHQGERVWLTRAATFEEKAGLFPGATFVVGADTILRVGDPRYYQGDPARRRAAVEKIAASGCRFLVFGRAIDSEFRTLEDLPLPAALRSLCTAVPERKFRRDISSTDLRRR